jgi:hypothetical protein
MILKSTVSRMMSPVDRFQSGRYFSLYPDGDVMSATLAATVVTQSGLGDYNITTSEELSGNSSQAYTLHK